MSHLTELSNFNDLDGNTIITEQDFTTNVNITFRGKNNRLIIAPGAKIKRLHATFDCDNGTLTIGANPKTSGGMWNIRVGQDSTVAIGEDVTTTATCVISAVEGTTVTIGDDVMFASGNQIRADDGHPIFDVASGARVNHSRSITIGNHVWLAYEACVLGGAVIGDGSVIGFKSFVNSEIPNNVVAVGAPARVARKNIAWERPHLSLNAPFYKPDSTSVEKSEYWNYTAMPQLKRKRRWSAIRR